MTDLINEIASDLENSKSIIASGLVHLGTVAIAISMAGKEFSDRLPAPESTQAVTDCLNVLIAQVVNGTLRGYDPKTRLPLTLLEGLSELHFSTQSVIDHRTLLRINEFGKWADEHGLLGISQILDDIAEPFAALATPDLEGANESATAQTKAILHAYKLAEPALFDYWLKMPAWEPIDAVYLLTFRTDPLNANPSTAYISSLPMIGLAEHFQLFGLIDNHSIELDGLHIQGKKRAPSEWIECYQIYPGAEPLQCRIPAISVSPQTRDDRAHVSNGLAILNQAAAKFWANADRDDRSTHPNNSDVAAWLVDKGFSQKTANSAATIIRPDWAPTGRKPEE